MRMNQKELDTLRVDESVNIIEEIASIICSTLAYEDKAIKIETVLQDNNIIKE